MEILAIGCILLVVWWVFNTNKRDIMSEIDDELKGNKFHTSKAVYLDLILNKVQIRIDDINKKIAICYVAPNKKVVLIDYTDILECDIIEDDNFVMKGGVGRAIVGEAIAGATGAIIGATTRKGENVVNNLQIRIVTQNIANPLHTIDIIVNETKKETDEYKKAIKFANEVYALITVIVNSTSRGDTKDVQYPEYFYNIEEKVKLYGEKNKIMIIKSIMEETGLDMKQTVEIIDNYYKSQE